MHSHAHRVITVLAYVASGRLHNFLRVDDCIILHAPKGDLLAPEARTILPGPSRDRQGCKVYSYIRRSFPPGETAIDEQLL